MPIFLHSKFESEKYYQNTFIEIYLVTRYLNADHFCSCSSCSCCCSSSSYRVNSQGILPSHPAKNEISVLEHPVSFDADHHCLLFFFQVDVISRETSPSSSEKQQQQQMSGEKFPSELGHLLLLRMAPHRADTSTEILAECSLDHPFFVKEKGE